MRLILKLTLLAGVFITLAVLENPADAQQVGSHPDCSHTYDPGPAASYTGYVLDETYRWVDVFTADATPHRIQPAPAGTVLSHPGGTITRMLKCYSPVTTTPPDPTPTPAVPEEPENPEVPTPTPTPEVPVPTPTPEAPPFPTFDITCSQSAVLTSAPEGWTYEDGTPIQVGDEVPNGTFLYIEGLPAYEIFAPPPETCGAPEPALPELDPECMEDEPCWDCETMGDGICGEPEEGTSSVPPQSPDPGTGESTDEGSDHRPSDATATPVPGEDVLAYTDSTVTYFLITLGLTLLAAGVGLLIGPPIGRRIGEWLGRR